MAQIIAKLHPDVVEGLVLSNTCSLAKDRGEETYCHLMGMIQSQKKSKWGKYGKDAVQKAGMSMKREETKTKELLINAGREVFLEKEFAGASLRKIC